MWGVLALTDPVNSSPSWAGAEAEAALECSGLLSALSSALCGTLLSVRDRMPVSSVQGLLATPPVWPTSREGFTAAQKTSRETACPCGWQVKGAVTTGLGKTRKCFFCWESHSPLTLCHIDTGAWRVTATQGTRAQRGTRTPGTAGYASGMKYPTYKRIKDPRNPTTAFPGRRVKVR